MQLLAYQALRARKNLPPKKTESQFGVQTTFVCFIHPTFKGYLFPSQNRLQTGATDKFQEFSMPSRVSLTPSVSRLIF